MKNSLDNFNAYIKQSKQDYKELNTAQSWDEDIWISYGDFLSNANKNLNFTLLLKKDYGLSNKIYITDRDFINWMKSEATNYAKLGKGDIKRIMVAAQKHLYLALLAKKTNAHPRLIDDQVLYAVEKRYQELGITSLWQKMNKMLSLLGRLKEKGIVPVGITYENNHVPKLAGEAQILAQKNKKAYLIDDEVREGEEKCISIKALHSLAWLSQRDDLCQSERLGLYIMHLLFATGCRIGEILRLKKDALTSVYAISQETGKPILNKKGEPELIYGLEYFPEKGAKTKYKWFDKIIAPLVIKAFNEILKITKDCRKKLEYLELNPNKPIRWDCEEINTREFKAAYSSATNYQSVYYTLSFQSEVSVKPIRKITDKLRHKGKNAREAKNNKPSQFVYRIRDLNKYYCEKFKYEPNLFFLMNKKEICIKKSELLLIDYPGAFFKKAYYKLFPSNIKDESVRQFFGSGSSNNSIFDRYNLKEDDGSTIKMLTHLPRHQLNTFLSLVGVTEHQQAIILGRQEVAQNRHYQHLTLEDKTKNQVSISQATRALEKIEKQNNEIVNSPPSSFLAEMGETPTKLELQQNIPAFNAIEEQSDFLEDALEHNTLLGELQDTYNVIKEKEGIVSAKDFIATHGNNFHVVVNGGCTRNVALHGCMNHLRCLQEGGCKHLVITGRPGELEMIEKTYKNLYRNVTKMEDLVKKGILISANEITQLETEKLNLKKMTTVVDKARNFKGIPIPVFKDSLKLDSIAKRDTVIDNFAKDQLKLEQARMEKLHA